jgi:hypothetical protein
VLDIPVKSAAISAEGDVDLRGTLGITDGVPVGFKEIRLHFDVETDAPQSDLAQLLEVTERYCVISDDPEQPEHKGPNERGSRLTGASAHVHVRSCLPARFSRSSGETARIHI